MSFVRFCVKVMITVLDNSWRILVGDRRFDSRYGPLWEFIISKIIKWLMSGMFEASGKDAPPYVFLWDVVEKPLGK